MTTQVLNPSLLSKSLEHTSSDSLPYAGFWSRAAAHSIDWLIVSVALFVLSLFLTVMAKAIGLGSSLILTLLILMNLLFIAAYFTLQESSKYRATLGKRLVGLYVVSTNNLQRMTFAQAIIRNSYKIIAPIPLVGIISVPIKLSCASVAFTSRKQGIQDILAGAIVLAGPKTRAYVLFERFWLILVFLAIIGIPFASLRFDLLNSSLKNTGRNTTASSEMAATTETKSKLVKSGSKVQENIPMVKTKKLNHFDEIDALLDQPIKGRRRN